MREGVTNILRHSKADRCSICLTPDSVEIHDDGVGLAGSTEGNGLMGLRNRVEAAGATMTTGCSRTPYAARMPGYVSSTRVWLSRASPRERAHSRPAKPTC
ncbi:MAG: ATP-binding protein [Nocardioidaceae bacterium]